MATREEVMAAIVNADKKGDSKSVRELGAYLKTMDAAPAAAAAPTHVPGQSVTDDMSGLERFHAGAGKAFYDAGNGIKQLLDKPAVMLENMMGDKAANAMAKFTGTPTAKASAQATQDDINDRKVLATPLMKTTSGFAGNVSGNVAIALPAAFIPGGQSIAGAAATGAGLGFIQPVADDESRALNTGIGAAAGPLGVLGGRAVAATWKGGKALVEPFTRSGRDAIAARTLERFGVQAGDVAGLTGQATTTGAQRTMAEQVARPEGAAAAARLQDSMRALDPQIAAQFEAREMANNAARVGTLTQLAGKDGGREFAASMRENAAKELYGKAFGTKLDMSSLTSGERGELTKLLNAPAVQDAMKAAKTMAANQMKSTKNQNGSVEGMHLMKLAMDDAIEAAGKGGSAVAVNKAMSIKMARDRMVGFLQRMSPDYAEARGTYAAMSKPLNQMDIADEVLKRGASSTTDLAGNVRLMPNAVANAMKDEARLVSQATGGRAKSTLADMLEPDQLAKLKAVSGEVDRVGAVARAGNGPGSATAQRLASQNVLRQVLGPTGLPESWAESTLLNTAMRPVQFAYNGIAEPRIQQVITELLLDPSRAQAVMQAARTSPASLPPHVRAALPYLEQALRVSSPAAAVSGQR